MTAFDRCTPWHCVCNVYFLLAETHNSTDVYDDDASGDGALDAYIADQLQKDVDDIDLM
jgi:hypothetical protein